MKQNNKVADIVLKLKNIFLVNLSNFFRFFSGFKKLLWTLNEQQINFKITNPIDLLYLIM